MNRLLTALTAVATLLALPTVAAAQNRADAGLVPAGVSAGGIDLAGLTLTAAQDRLAQDPALVAHLQRSLTIRITDRNFTVGPKTTGLTLDALRTAKRAIRATAPGAVPLAFTYNKVVVAGWVDRVGTRVDRAARDATMRITLRHIVVRRSKPGIAIPREEILKTLVSKMTTPGSPARATFKVRKLRAAINADDLRNRNQGTVITIDRANFKLRLFKHLKFARSYQVAVGQPAYPTPSGLFSISNKQIDPVWSVPNSPWAGELGGTTVAGGSAANPLKARWMGITDGIGIHGTGDDWSIGSRASHGCIRMHVWDVKALYPRVPVGTPVLIK